jgi:L-arabinose isomerase
MSPPKPVIWFVTGSQHLYGEEALKKVAADTHHMVAAMNAGGRLPLELVCQPVMVSPEAIRQLALEANSDPSCAGLILWMHTFSPAKMWIGGLSTLQRPFLHLHTQFHRDLPWGSIDMDFMNLHQAAHGDREAGFIHTRMRLGRKVVAGYWDEPTVKDRLASWMRVARGWHDLQGAKFVRFGDNMRQVAVTEGDKVAAEMKFGFSVNTYGIGDLVSVMHEVADHEIDPLCAEYEQLYRVVPELRKGGARHGALREGARIELALRAFLRQGNFKGFTTTFEDLHGLAQLPGLAVQRLMAEGYGFGAEGDWKTCALLRAAKVMAEGADGGTSFMEDYTYHLEAGRQIVLGAHMLEICPSIAAEQPALQIHPLGIGGKDDPVRLVFNAASGPAVNISLIHLGNRFRLLVNEVDSIRPPSEAPKLPVARAVWECRPDFQTACEAWIYAGGAHHTVFSHALTTGMVLDFAAIAGVEAAAIDQDTRIESFCEALRWNEAYYHLAGGMVA